MTQKIAMLTAGGLAPCLSSAVGGLIETYSKLAPDTELIAYRSGYQGLLLGDNLSITPQMRDQAHKLHALGGSPIGNSRVKLTNQKDAEKRGLVKSGQDPLEAAAHQLAKDNVTILHTIGGDDTNTTAADLAKYLADNGHQLTVVGLPKTVDNDIVPIRQSLGAITAAEVGARFFDNVVNEQSAARNTLVIHEVMGRHSGWLTAATARAYSQITQSHAFADGMMMNAELKGINAIYIPEQPVDLEAESDRLKKVMSDHGHASLFISEGAAIDEIVAAREAAGEAIRRDAFGHVKIDDVNVGAWFAKQFADSIGAERVLVQKSGYFARSAPANTRDLELIATMVAHGVNSALNGHSGVVGHDEAANDQLSTISFDRIAGGKPFDPDQQWFDELLQSTGQQ